MIQKCHGSGCEKSIIDNYYCEECYNELQNQKQEPKQKEKPKINEAKLIHKAMFGS
jgi:hypothetical protein